MTSARRHESILLNETTWNARTKRLPFVYGVAQWTDVCSFASISFAVQVVKVSHLAISLSISLLWLWVKTRVPEKNLPDNACTRKLADCWFGERRQRLENLNFLRYFNNSHWHWSMVNLGKSQQSHIAALPQVRNSWSIFPAKFTYDRISYTMFIFYSNAWNPTQRAFHYLIPLLLHAIFTRFFHSFYIKKLSFWAAISRVNYKNNGRACQRCDWSNCCSVNFEKF